jgi:membrane AbrB-like protein
MDRGRRRLLLDGAAVLAAAVGAGLLLDLLSVPSPAIFGGLAAGLGRALLARDAAPPPRPAGLAAQAVIGVSIGALVQPETLRTIAQNWAPVLGITVATLLVSLLAGQLMRLQRGVSAVTGAFSMIAGGASGITAMARDLGADEQLVGVLQYLRVLVIVVVMPVVATTVFGADAGSAPPAAPSGPGWPAELLFTAVCVAAGMVLGRVARLPVGALLGPLAGALPLALALIVGSVLACAGLGLLLSRTAGVTPLEGYLATTPGGIYAVLATATGAGADATFVLAVQVLRLFVMLFSAPLLARWLRPSRS